MFPFHSCSPQQNSHHNLDISRLNMRVRHNGYIRRIRYIPRSRLYRILYLCIHPLRSIYIPRTHYIYRSYHILIHRNRLLIYNKRSDPRIYYIRSHLRVPDIVRFRQQTYSRYSAAGIFYRPDSYRVNHIRLLYSGDSGLRIYYIHHIWIVLNSYLLHNSYSTRRTYYTLPDLYTFLDYHTLSLYSKYSDH